MSLVITGPDESFCGIGALLKGTIVITSVSLVWYCLINLYIFYIFVVYILFQMLILLSSYLYACAEMIWAATFLPNSFVFESVSFHFLFIKNGSLCSTSAQTYLIILLKVWLKGCDENGIFQSGANVLPFTTRWQHWHGATGFTHNKHKKTEKWGRMNRKQYFMVQNFTWHNLDFINVDQIEKDAKKNHNISRRGCYAWLP